MTPAEFIQLKAFARIDGALMAAIWTGSFACYIAGTASPMLMICGMGMAVGSLLFAHTRLRNFRDTALEGTISFGRAYAYTMLIFFYASILFAIAQFIYFQYIDNGYIVSKMAEMVNIPQNRQMIEAYGLAESMDESLKMMAGTRAIDYALNYLTVNITIGIIAGLPMALLARTGGRTEQR